MNLKKISGSSRPDYKVIEKHAIRDREYIREELDIIDPDVIVVCGEAKRIFLKTMFGKWLKFNREHWKIGRHTILAAHHPSCRPFQARKAFSRIIKNAKLAHIWRNI